MDPLSFESYSRPRIWGHSRLRQRYGKPAPHGAPADVTIGETWEISGHAEHVSIVADGPLAGQSLVELCERHSAEIFGTNTPRAFPLLIKFLDAHELLSIQVHPDDATARRLLGQDCGKSEAWIVIEAELGSLIYAGLAEGITRADLERNLADGTLASCLHSFAPKRGDVVYLPAGTIHAIGGGVVVFEIQQTSDATFRLFDWNRLDVDGRPRALHLDESLAAIDWSRGPVSPTAPIPLDGLPEDVAGERLVAGPYFEIYRYTLANRLACKSRKRFSIWAVLDGSAILETRGGAFARTLRQCETTLIPASAGAMVWRPASAEAVTLIEIVEPEA